MTANPDEDLNEFFAGIKPIEQDTVVLKSKEEAKQKKTQQVFDNLDKQNDPNYLATDFIDWIDVYEPLAFKKDGLQEGVYKKLRLGKYPIESRLDLYKKTTDQARQEVFYFIQDCLKADVRCVLINHGLGLKSNPPGRLKSYVSTWLGQLDKVLAFHSAQKHHGGLAATYVLLTKSDRKRLENRERFNR